MALLAIGFWIMGFAATKRSGLLAAVLCGIGGGLWMIAGG